MPFDSTTYTKADPLDLDAMIAWLETMPAEGEYDFYRNDRCLLAQRLTTAGVEFIPLDMCRYQFGGTVWEPPTIAYCMAVLRKPHTYGAALSRFRALQEGAS